MNAQPLTHGLLLLTLLALAGANNSVAAQTAPDGYRNTISQVADSSLFAATPGGGSAWFTGDSIELQGPTGTHTPLQLSSSRFGSFLKLIENDSALLFGESSTGEIYRVPLDGSPAQLLTVVPFNYDATMLGSNHVVISAKLGGFSAPDNDLIAIELSSGASTPIGLIPGASGAVFATATELLYATAPAGFPAPLGTVSVLSFSTSQWSNALATGTPLTTADATTLFSGLDAVGFMVLDDDDDLLFTDWLNVRVAEIDDLHSARRLKTVIDYSGTNWFPGSVQLLRATTSTEPFEPFARHTGDLRVFETDFLTTPTPLPQVRTIAPVPLTLTAPSSPVPSGPVGLTLTDAPPGGLALVAFQLALSGATGTITLPGVERQLALDLAILTPVSTQLLLIDGQGVASLSLTNPGGLTGLSLVAQSVALSANADTLAASQAQQITLGN